jgi:dipeptidyl aminopeptidase/acylaminoacyl peptidase
MLGTTGDVKDFDTGEHLDQSSRVQAVVNYFGPADLLSMGKQSGPESRMNHDAADSPESQLIGGPVQENAAKAKRASPLTYVSAGDAPMLLVHGTADPLVPAQQSRDLHAALEKAGVPATLHLVEGAGHGNGFGDPENRVVNAFIQERLSLKAPAGP